MITSRFRHPAILAYLRVIRLALMVFGVILAFVPRAAHADDLLDITLRSSEDASFIGPYSFITNRKPGSDLTEIDIAQHHRERKLGALQPYNTVRIPTTYRQVWLTFSVHNRTDNSRWIIDFGDAIDGRLGLVSRIRLFNDMNKQAVEFTRGQDGRFFGAAIPLKIQPQSRALIVMMIEGERGLPLTMTPRIISEDAFIRDLLHANIFSAVIYAFFTLILIAYLIFVIQTGKREYIGFFAVFCLLAIIYTLTDTLFQTPNALIGEMIVGFYALAGIIAALSTKRFLNITSDETPLEHRLVVVSIGAIGAAALVHMSILNQNDYGFFLINMALCLNAVLMIFISALAGQKKDLPVKFFCAGWSFSFLASIIIGFTATGLIPANLILIGLFWYMFVLQGACFVYTHFEAIRLERENKEKERVRRLHDTQAISRLQKSKETADQARLLRIIERERALLSELREREVLRAEEMRLAKEAADRANAAKSAFLAVVSHEIRTPMTGILGMVQLLRDTNLNKTQADFIDTIRKSGDSMMALLNDILDFEKIEHGSMRLENMPFDLRQLVQDVITLMNGQAVQHKLYLTASIAPEVPRAVFGDPTRLRQVLLNLVGNGLKFTREGGVTIQISVMNATTDTPLLRYSVIDTGIGIPQSAQNKLFQPFAQAEDGTTRKYGGTGLGLAICGKLVEAMGSKIKIISEEGAGSTFQFALSLLEYKGDMAVLPQSTAAETKTYNTKPMRILIAEDNEINQKVLQGLLGRDNHTLLFAFNGHEALELCRKHMPDLVLMDIQMAGLNGLDTTKTLRADLNPRVAGIPVIALTGNVLMDDIDAYYAANMNGFIPKPIDGAKLRETIYNASLGKFENPIIRKYETADTQSLDKLKHNLELDDFDNFLLLQKQQQQKQKTEDHALLKMKVNLNLDEDELNRNRPEKTQHHNKTKDEELTEIQKFLQENYQAQQTTEAQEPPPITPPAEPPSEPKSEPALDIPAVPSDEEITILMQGAMQAEPEPAQTPPAPPLPPEEPPAPETPAEQTNKPSVFGASGIKIHDIKPSGPSKPPAPKPAAPDIKILDEDMLESLSSALGRTQFATLLTGFLKKTDEIISEIEDTVHNNDIKGLGDRAHDLKGMAGNFGMVALSGTAGDAEKAAKRGAADTATEYAGKLRYVADLTRAALKDQDRLSD